MALRLAAATLTYLWSCDFAATCRRIADIGFRLVEVMCAPPPVWPRSLTAGDRSALRRMLGEVGLEVVALNPTYLDLNLASPNRGMREESVRQIKELVTLAADLGAPRVVTVAGRRHPLLPTPLDQAWQWARESIGECVPLAEQLGVELTLENAWNVLDDADGLVRMATELHSDRVRVVYDSANSREAVLPALATVRPFLTHVHLSDARPGPWGHLPIGTGEVDFAGIHTQLSRDGFTGVSVIEAVDQQRPDWAMQTSKTHLECLGWTA